MTSQTSDSSESLGLDGTWMTAIDDQATQDDYSVTDGATTSSSDAESAARWIRDPSTVDPSRWPHSPSVEWLRESGTMDPWPQSPSEWVREPSIREPFRAPLPISMGFHSGSPTVPVTYPTPSIWEPPPRTASPSSLEQDHFPYEVASASVDHAVGDAVDFSQSVRTGTAGADQATRPRGRPTSRGSKSDDNHSVYSSYFSPPLAGRSRQTSIVNESRSQARTPSNPAPPSTKPRSNVSKSADGGRARRPSKPPPSTVDAETLPGANAMSEIWPLYIVHTLAEDKETVAAWNSDLDAILIFAALFSAVLTTFIIESYTNLQADPTVELLQAILFELQVTRNASTAPASPMGKFQVAASAFRVNLYWFTSLILSLATALITILAKQWVNYLLAGLSPIPATRARHRQYRIDGMHRWNLPAILSFLPVLLHVALLLFFAGLVDFVWDVNRSIAVFSAVLVCTTCIVYVIANVLAYIYPDCPFKTSVSVVFSLIINLLVIAYGKTCVTVVKIGRASSRLWARGILACNSLYRRWCRRAGGSLIGEGLVPLSRVGTITVSTARNYESLRIASLRSQDEQFIEENKTVMDTRILLWLMRNADRVDELEKLCHAITHFPHLVAHRQLFIQQGGLLFLERLLQNAMSSKYSKLSKERRDTATSAMYALAVLESEVDTARLRDRAGLLDIVATSAPPDHTPYVMVEATINPARSPLSPSTYPVIISLLHEGGNLPISTMASALRLCVRIPDTTAQRGRIQPIKPLALKFLRRVTQLQSSPEMHSDINHAVNTVVYLALHDVSYPQRDGFLLPCIGDAPYWLNYLSDLMSRPFATAEARRQMCWAVCALAPSLQVSSAAEVVKPRVPRRIDIQTFARRLTGLISCDVNPDVLNAALVAFEGLLWTATGEERGDVANMAHLLTPAHLAFTAQIQRRLKLNQANVSEVAKITPSITRIAVYLSIYHPVLENTLRIALLQNVFWILAHLLEASQLDSTPLYVDAHVLKGLSPQTTMTQRLRGNEATRWIYRAASRMIMLFLNLGGKPTGDSPSAPIDSKDLVFSDIAVSTPAGAALTLALQSIVGRTTMADASGLTMDPFILESFAMILTDAFFRGMPDTVSRDAGAWDWEATRIVAHIAGRGGLSALLTVSSYNTTARLSALSMALRTIRVVLNADTGSRKGRPTRTRIPRHWHSPSHPANVLAAMFRDQYAPFCQRLTELTQVGEPMRHLDMEGALVDFIRLSGNLAFFGAPPHADWPDPPIISTLLPFLACLTADYAPGPTLFMARRHAWGALGSIATLYTLTAEELRVERNPERHFRFDAFRADDVAAGLLRALVFSSIEDGPDTEPHCERCHFGHREYIRLLFRWVGHTLPDASVTHKVFMDIATIALKAIAALWKTEDPESVELRESLRRHGLSSRLRPFLEGSDMTELANEVMTQVFDAERETPPDSPETPR